MMRFLQVSLVFLVVVFLSLIGSVVYGQDGNPELGFYISRDTGIALGTVLVLIAAIATLAFKAGYSARRQEELEARVAKIEGGGNCE